MTNLIDLTFSQCKALIEAGEDLRDFVERLNNQPDFMGGVMSIDSGTELAAIIDSGCAANAHGSVYSIKAMAEHGDSVLEYLENQLGEVPSPTMADSWSSMASSYLSMAIECWANQFSDHSAILWQGN
jgi:hypothetical protein